MYFKIALIVWTGLFSLTVHGQDFREKSVAGETLELKVSSATVLKWFTFLEQQGVRLSYNSSQIDLGAIVTLPLPQITVDEMLQQLLAPYDFTLRYVGAQKVLIQIKGQKTVRLKGKVVNGDSGEVLLGYTVSLMNRQGKKYTAYSGPHGDFSIQVPWGKYLVTTSYLGFANYRAYWELKSDQNQTIALQPLSIPMKEVVVTPPPYADEANYYGTSNRLSVSSSDPMASVRFLPGITGAPVNGEYYVNGGQSDENQILLDGIPIYHSHHNNSLVALFNGDAVKDISFYGSFIPAQYEGRLSSVTDVKLKEGDSLEHHQTINLEMPAAALTLEGPIVKNKLTYMLSGRHSWLDFMHGVFEDTPGLNRAYADLTGKLCYYLTPNTTLHGMVYRTNDLLNDSTEYSHNQKILQWKGGVYSVGLKTLLARNIQHTSHVGYSEYANQVFAPAIGIPVPYYIHEGMNRFHLKSDFRMKLDQGVELSYGLKYSQERFNLLASKDTVENNKYHISQFSFYGNTKLYLTPQLVGSVALNMVAYLPKGHTSYFSIQPRFTLKYSPDPQNSFSLDFSRMEQFYHNICLDAIPVPSDFRMPSIQGFKPSSSVHLEGGWRHISRHWYGAVSTYYKRRFHILGVRYDFEPSLEGWERFVMKGNAHSGGIKVRFSANGGRWSGDLSYTYSRSKEWFADYDEGRKHPALQDLPHELNWGTSCRVGDRSYLTLGGYVRSGYFTNLFSEEPTSLKLMERSSRSHCNYRLDLNFLSAKTTKKKNLEIRYKLGLYNVIGNPRNEEVIDLYSVDTQKHCLPYFALNLAF